MVFILHGRSRDSLLRPDDFILTRLGKMACAEGHSTGERPSLRYGVCAKIPGPRSAAPEGFALLATNSPYQGFLLSHPCAMGTRCRAY